MSNEGAADRRTMNRVSGMLRGAIVALAGCLAGCSTPATAQAQAQPGIVHDAEFYILQAQHGDKWAAEDKDIAAKLAALKQKYGRPPNIVHIMWDDTGVGSVGNPFIQKTQGFETPTMNRLAAEGMNFTRMYTEPSCTPSRAAVMTGRHPVRNGMYTVGFPYEYGGLAADEVTMAEVLSPAGYATAFHGKSHLGDVESSYLTNQGFDEALWTPYNQATALYTQRGQHYAMAPAVMYPEMYAKDPYDIDPGWRPKGFVFALEGTKGGPVNEFGRAPNPDDWAKVGPECVKRSLEFMRKNAAAKKPFYLAHWPVFRPFTIMEGDDAKNLTASGAWLHEALATMDRDVQTLTAELTKLGIAENTLVILMADNGAMKSPSPAGMIETMYRGGKGEYLEGAVRVPCIAWWPGVIKPGQLVGDIVHETDLFTTFARLGGATQNIPTDRIIDGIDQTSLLLNGDGFSRRDYAFIYTGPNMGALVKGRYKRHVAGGHAGFSGAEFYDLYTDPRESKPMQVAMFPAKGMFTLMKARHQAWIKKYPNKGSNRDLPLQNIANARPETIEASKMRMDRAKLPFDPMEYIKLVPEWENITDD